MTTTPEERAREIVSALDKTHNFRLHLGDTVTRVMESRITTAIRKAEAAALERAAVECMNAQRHYKNNNALAALERAAKAIRALKAGGEG